MKKLILVFLITALLTLAPIMPKAASLNNFEEVTIEGKGKLLLDYTQKELKSFYKETDKRLFFGWRTYEINHNVKISFRKTTLFSYYNDGTTPITYEFQETKTKESKYVINSTGNINKSFSGTIEKFKLGLEDKLSINTSVTISASTKEVANTKIYVDPGTMLNLYVMGNGKVTNGAASYYTFWIRVNQGGYEYCNIASLFYRLEKVKI